MAEVVASQPDAERSPSRGSRSSGPLWPSPTRSRSRADAHVVSRHQQRFIDDMPWSLQTSYYPMTLVEQGATRLIQATDIPRRGGRLPRGASAASSRLATATRSPCARRMRPRPDSSSCPATDGSRCSRSSGSASTRPATESASPSPCIPRTATGSWLMWATYRQPNVNDNFIGMMIRLCQGRSGHPRSEAPTGACFRYTADRWTSPAATLTRLARRLRRLTPLLRLLRVIQAR